MHMHDVPMRLRPDAAECPVAVCLHVCLLSSTDVSLLHPASDSTLTCSSSVQRRAIRTVEYSQEQCRQVGLCLAGAHMCKGGLVHGWVLGGDPSPA